MKSTAATPGILGALASDPAAAPHPFDDEMAASYDIAPTAVSLAPKSPPKPKASKTPPILPMERSDLAVRRVVYAIEYGYGPQVIKSEIEQGAIDLARYVDNAGPADMPARTAYWTRQLRMIPVSNGDEVDKAQLLRVTHDVASAQANNAQLKDIGLHVAKTKAGAYKLRSDAGGAELALPRLTGSAIVKDNARFASRLMLAQAALSDVAPERIQETARSVFSNIHEKEHNLVDSRVFYAPTNERTKAFVASVLAWRQAKTPAEKQQAGDLLVSTLFAEQMPKNKIASIAIDLLTPLGRINAADDLAKNAKATYAALKKGDYLAAGSSAFWSAIDLVGTIGGLRVGKLAEMGVRQTKAGRKYTSAARAAKMQKAGEEGRLPSVNAEEMLGSAFWNRLDEKSQIYLAGMLPVEKGDVGEYVVRDHMKSIKANPQHGNRDITKGTWEAESGIEIEPAHQHMLPKSSKNMRYDDEILEETKLERVFGIFLLPASSPGRKTRIEVKTDHATGGRAQKAKDKIIEENKDIYKTEPMMLLRLPYSDLPKQKVHEQIMYYLHRKATVNKNSGIRFSEDEITKLIKQTDRAMKAMVWNDRVRTMVDFMSGLAARLAVASENQYREQNG